MMPCIKLLVRHFDINVIELLYNFKCDIEEKWVYYLLFKKFFNHGIINKQMLKGVSLPYSLTTYLHNDVDAVPVYGNTFGEPIDKRTFTSIQENYWNTRKYRETHCDGYENLFNIHLKNIQKLKVYDASDYSMKELTAHRRFKSKLMGSKKRTNKQKLSNSYKHQHQY